MPEDPVHPESGDLSQQVDDALHAFWRGDTTVLDKLVTESDSDHAETHELFRGLRGAQSVPGVRLDGGGEFEGFRILREIGRGGMGVVYAAEQQRPKRTVALKLLRSGFVSRRMLRRFEHEAHLLGRLQHPGIAQVFEAGTAQTHDGPQPYFVMELIEGQRITDYCTAHALDTRARLELFCRVCDAVRHAHQKGIIHRDLKPGNIFIVDDPGRSPHAQPKVLDFGVARATETDGESITTQTRAGQLVGTIPYMSPEQVAGDPQEMDTRSDVYALGVVLYELLSGRLPYDLKHCSIPEAARRIQDETPERLGALDRSYRGEIEIMVAKALDKDRTRRYQSAAALGADIRHYLAGEPIDARRDSAIYVLRKNLRRYRGVSASVLVFLISLSGFAVYAGFQAQRERDARQQAESARTDEQAQRRLAEAGAAAAAKQAARADAVKEFLQSMLAAADPRRAQGHDVTVRHVLDDAVRQMNAGSLTAQPDVEAEVRATIANTYYGLGLFKSAVPHFAWLYGYRERTLGADHPETLDAMLQLADANNEAGEIEKARDLFQDCLKLATQAQGQDSELTLKAMDGLGNTLMRLGHADKAEPLHLEALETVRRMYGEENELFLATTFNLSSVYRDQGRLDEAEPLYLRALELSRKLNGDESYVTARIRWQLARDIYRPTGRAEQAETLLRRALADARRGLGDEHTETVVVLVQLSRALVAQGKLDQAERVLRESVAAYREIRGVESNDTMRAVAELSSVVAQRGHNDESADVLTAGFERARKAHGVDHLMMARWAAYLARVDAHAQRWKAADAGAQLALDIRSRILAADDPSIASVAQTLGWEFNKAGRFDLAAPLFRRALSIRRMKLGLADPESARSAITLAYALWYTGEPDAAAATLREAYDALRADHAAPDETVRWLYAYCARLLCNVGRHADALAIDRECLDAARTRYGGDSLELAGILREHGAHLLSSGHAQSAADKLKLAVDIHRARESTESGAYWVAEMYLAESLGMLGRSREALPLARAAHEKLTEKLGDAAYYSVRAERVIYELMLEAGQASEAEHLLRRFIEDYPLPKTDQGYRYVQFSAQSLLGRCLMMRGKTDEALEPLRTSYEALRSQWGEAFSETQKARHRLIEYYKAVGREDLADELRARD